MAIHVKITKKDGTEQEPIHGGEHCAVTGSTIILGAEPHELRGGGLIDPFIGKVIVLEPGDTAEVVRV